MEHEWLPNMYLIWKDEGDFKNELIKFETNILRKLCGMSEFSSHNIKKATDKTIWLDSFDPVIICMGEIKFRHWYATSFKKNA
jgi:hypothetical protein